MFKKNRKGAIPVVAVLWILAALAAISIPIYVKYTFNISLWMAVAVVVGVLILLRR